jgi:hypothetical protein
MHREENVGRSGIQRYDAPRRPIEGRDRTAEIIAFARGRSRCVAVGVAGAASKKERAEQKMSEMTNVSTHERAPDPKSRVPVNESAKELARSPPALAPEGLRMWRGREASPGFGLRARLPDLSQWLREHARGARYSGGTAPELHRLPELPSARTSVVILSS